MTTVVDDEQGILMFVILDEGPYPHHQIEVRVVGRDGKDISVEAVVFAEACLEIFKLR